MTTENSKRRNNRAEKIIPEPKLTKFSTADDKLQRDFQMKYDLN